MNPGQMSQAQYIQELETKVINLTQLIETNSILNKALLQENARMDSLLGYLMNAAAKITDSESASVLLWDSHRNELYFAATTTDNDASKGLIGKPVPMDSLAGTILKERRMLHVDDTESDPRHYRGTDQDINFETRSLLGVPMIARNNPIGVLEVVNKFQLPWTPSDRSNLSVLAAEAAIIIEVANLVTDIQRANEELSELDKLKSDFIAIASHELRTPLGIILGYASFLQDTDDQSVSQHATKVMDSALQLRRIIEDMINLRYLKQKTSDLFFEEVTLGDILDDLQRDTLTLTDLQSHNVHIVCEKPTTTVTLDRNRISMALTNILNNAVAFSPEGGDIIVSAFAYDDSEVWFTVSDQGIGLEEEEFAKIFEEFYQVEDHMIRHVGGLGIGLSITRALVIAHGGRIWAESPGLGEGTTFTIALPRFQ